MARTSRQLQALLRSCQAGDNEAFDELIRLWEPKLFYFVRRLVPCESDAWDVLQQIWTHVVRGITGVRDSSKFVPWMYRVARNTAYSHQRSLVSRERWVDREASVEELTGVEAIEPEWTVEDVHRGLDTLPSQHREVLTLFFLHDLSVEELAGVLGVAEGTVKSRLYYGKKALRLALERNKGER